MVQSRLMMESKSTHQVIELDGRDTAVHTTDHLLGDLDRINMCCVKTVTQS